MNDIGLRQILGKTITGVVIKQNNHKKWIGPDFQIKLVFLDRTNFEIYVDSPADIRFGGGIDPGGIEAARKYMGERMDIIVDLHLDENGRIVKTDHDKPAQ